MTNPNQGLSIGEVARATGISVHTLRQWERRYGSPRSMKLESGHRRYSPTELERLKLVKTALGLGIRANEVVALPAESVMKLIEERGGQGGGSLVLEYWSKCAKDRDEARLIDYFEADWENLGPIGFVEDRLAPFMRRIGEGWAHRSTTVAQEHFVSELAVSFLSRKWRAINHECEKGLFVLASLNGETHNLGLHMCAVTLTASGHRVLFLGGRTPIEDVIATCRMNGGGRAVTAVCITYSTCYSQAQAVRELRALRESVPRGIPILIGGDGAPENVNGVLRFNGQRSFYDWLQYERNNGGRDGNSDG